MIVIPIIKSAQKDLRRNLKRRERNLRRKQAVRDVTRQMRRLSAAKETAKAQELLPQLRQTVDKAAKDRTIHPNKAARIKSRLMRRLQGSRQ